MYFYKRFLSSVIFIFCVIFLCTFLIMRYKDFVIYKRNTAKNEIVKTSDLEGILSKMEKNNKMGSIQACKIGIDCTVGGKGQIFNHSTKAKSTAEMVQIHGDMKAGGVWWPDNCVSPSMVAIILPFRDREEHLGVFITNMIPFLKKQKKAFTIFVIEQVGPELFNRALLMNIGFLESQKLGNYSCYIFHDVDMVPVNLCNLYECSKHGVRHLGLSRDLKKPAIFYGAGLPAVSAFTTELYKKINGFTNIMFGWGGEDDEGYMRIKKEKLVIERLKASIGNYYHQKHVHETGNAAPGRGLSESTNNANYRKIDGLSSAKYKVHAIIREPLYTKILTSFPGPTTKQDAVQYFKKKTSEFQVSSKLPKT